MKRTGNELHFDIASDISDGENNVDTEPEQGTESGDNDDENKTPLALALDRLSEASKNAITIERTYAAVDPPRDEEEDDPKFANNLWKDVPALAHKLEKARSGLQQAWSDAQEAHDEECKKQFSQEDDDDYFFCIIFLFLVTDRN